MPLIDRWQLMGSSPRAKDDFWRDPVANPAFFAMELRALSASEAEGGPLSLPPAVIRPEGPLFKLELTSPIGTALYSELLDDNLTVLQFSDRQGVPAGAFTFSHVVHPDPEKAGRMSPRASLGRDQWELFIALPGPATYYVRVLALSKQSGGGPVEVLTIKIEYDGPGVSHPLPNVHRQWLYSRSQLVSPAPGAALRNGDNALVHVRAVDLVHRLGVGVPEGYSFTLLLAEGHEHLDPEMVPRGILLDYKASVRLPNRSEGDSYVITAQSDDADLHRTGIMVPLVHFVLDEQ